MIAHKEQQFSFLKIRWRWFVLQASEFVKRNQMGVLVVLFMLPGVAVGDNLLIFYRFLSTPFLQVVDAQGAALNRIVAWLSLLVIFLAWAKSQEQAIRGGPFAIYMKSLPLLPKHWLKADALMLILSNHLLWVLLISPFVLENLDGASIAHVVVLWLSLLLGQWLLIFSATMASFVLWVLGVACYLLLIPLLGNYASVLTAVLFTGAVLIVVQSDGDEKAAPLHSWTVLKKLPFWPAFYVQMLFRTLLASTLMRVGLCLLLLMGFVQAQDHLSTLNDGNVRPFLWAVMALLSYWLSGLFVKFNDIREAHSDMWKSLPVKKTYWVFRDCLVLLALSLLIFAATWLMLPNLATIWVLLFQWSLILVVYPLRVSGKSHQPFTTFSVILLITIAVIVGTS